MWRRLLVPEDITLIKLNVVLQQVMGWLGGHLHEYIVGRLHYGIPDDDWPSAELMIDERRVRSNTLVESGARRLIYLYDFGDGWEHTVKIEDVVIPTTTGAMKIRCLAGENACPPEDVGGPHSYFEFLTAIKDHTHEEHGSMLQWIGGAFDPVAFNINEVNERLAEIRP